MRFAVEICKPFYRYEFDLSTENINLNGNLNVKKRDSTLFSIVFSAFHLCKRIKQTFCVSDFFVVVLRIKIEHLLICNT